VSIRFAGFRCFRAFDMVMDFISFLERKVGKDFFLLKEGWIVSFMNLGDLYVLHV
jgi:hypothetical protein